jgi:hypothetical protein
MPRVSSSSSRRHSNVPGPSLVLVSFASPASPALVRFVSRGLARLFTYRALTYTPASTAIGHVHERGAGLNVVLIAKAGRTFLKCDVRWKRHAEPSIVNHVPLELPSGNYSLDTRESTERRASRE